MRQKQELWRKPRGHGNHFTLEDVAVIKAAFVARRGAAEIAERLQCSQRSVNRYFEKLRTGVPISRETRKPAPVVVVKRAAVDRRYHGSFDL